MFRLISNETIVQGTYWIQETAPSGAKKTCGPVPAIMDVASCLSGFRSANGLPRASITECLEDVHSFTCERLGNSTSICIECTPDEFLEVNRNVPGIMPCKGCGIPIEA